jgi:hypothetical protein
MTAELVNAEVAKMRLPDGTARDEAADRQGDGNR